MCQGRKKETYKQNLKTKVTCNFFLDYPEEYSADTFRIMKIKTKTIFLSSNVKKLGKSCGDYGGVKYQRSVIRFVF